MSADFNTELQISGTKNELRAVLKVLIGFVRDKDVYLNMVRIGKINEKGTRDHSSGVYLRDLKSKEEVVELLDSLNGNMAVEASGPYGHFYMLEEVGLFTDLADAAPDANIAGRIFGFDDGGEQSAWCKSEDGKLHIYYKYEDDEEDPYCDYIVEKLPCSEFEHVFKIEAGNMDESKYYAYVVELFEDGSIYRMSYQKFVEWLGFEIGINEDEFVKVIKTIKDLGIFNRDDFERDNANVPDYDVIYDPHEKE